METQLDNPEFVIFPYSIPYDVRVRISESNLGRALIENELAILKTHNVLPIKAVEAARPSNNTRTDRENK